MTNQATRTKVSSIHSKQPWFVINAAENFHVTESDLPSVSHFYSFKTNESSCLSVGIPDGCIDILFDCDEASPSAIVHGSLTEAQEVCFQNGKRYFGLRFLPGFIPDFLNISAPELVNGQCDIHDAFPKAGALFESIVYQSDFVRQVALMSDFLKANHQQKTTELTTKIVSEICRRSGNVRMKSLEEASGFTCRTLQRKFQAEIGMSPKEFSQVIRCQSAVYRINHGNDSTFSDLAFSLGFSDQAHFIREFKKQVNTTPLDYQNRIKHKSYLEKIHCY